MYNKFYIGFDDYANWFAFSGELLSKLLFRFGIGSQEPDSRTPTMEIPDKPRNKLPHKRHRILSIKCKLTREWKFQETPRLALQDWLSPSPSKWCNPGSFPEPGSLPSTVSTYNDVFCVAVTKQSARVSTMNGCMLSGVTDFQKPDSHSCRSALTRLRVCYDWMVNMHGCPVYARTATWTTDTIWLAEVISMQCMQQKAIDAPKEQ